MVSKQIAALNSKRLMRLTLERSTAFHYIDFSLCSKSCIGFWHQQSLADLALTRRVKQPPPSRAHRVRSITGQADDRVTLSSWRSKEECASIARQRKTGQPVKFEITEQTREAVGLRMLAAKSSRK